MPEANTCVVQHPHEKIEIFYPAEEISASGQRTLLYANHASMDKLPIVIPEYIPDEYHDIWVGMTEQSRRFALESYNDPEQLVAFLALQIPVEKQARESAKKTHKIIAAAATQEQLKLFSPFPTELTRTTCFFPMSTKEMANRPYIKEMVIASHSWGEVVYSGPKLSVFDEDLLMFLLAAINEANEKFIDQVDGVRTYTYRGSLHKILHAKNVKRAIGKGDYKDALASFKLMTGARLDLTTTTIGPGGKKIPKKTTFKNLITGGEYDHETGAFVCSVNPYFYETYAAGTVTWMDVAMRARIKSPNAKALYRFIQSHREDRWQGPYMTLAASLNIDLNLPNNKIRAHIRSSISDLIELDVLLQGSRLEANNVILLRNPKPHPKKKIAGQKQLK